MRNGRNGAVADHLWKAVPRDRLPQAQDSEAVPRNRRPQDDASFPPDPGASVGDTDNVTAEDVVEAYWRHYRLTTSDAGLTEAAENSATMSS